MDDGLIVETGEGLQFFRTPGALEIYAEAIDVENREYGRCWDPNGSLYELRPGGFSGIGLFTSGGAVTVQASRPPRNGADELRTALVAFLVRLGEPLDQLTPLSTSDLLAIGLGRAGWTE